MSFRVERTNARQWSDEQLAPLFADGFPPFIFADRLVKRYIDRVRKWFGDLDIVLLDDDDRPVAAGWGVPIRWTSELNDL